ncbi:group I truncated hemoglobin [Nocardioides kongjuensis]|uniref:Group 1 truncated hemoglobin n=1 Tax=Nocardioides kongjuensis TaxID=349522 RepID=A0A852S091_9ACTN|nr:group 1 truncated hemoglobin [Nocardioides kongjuensis]NYD32232.1 hemoglobin [Nocardioides kongjuensis]
MSAYDAIGGAGAVKAVVAVFYQRVLDDPDLRDWFEGIDLGRLKAHQRAFLSHALGGPELFAGRPLAQAHAGLEITDDAFDAVAEHLVMTLHDLGAGAEQIDQVRAALEARREVVVDVSAAPAPADH